MASTIFFDGFGPWGGEHIGEIDPLFWEKTSNVSLSEYRTDRSYSVINGTSNGLDFMGYTFGAVVKLNSHTQDADCAYLKAKNFPNSFSAGDTAFGLGFFINKLCTDSVARPNNNSGSNYASKFLLLQTTVGNNPVDVLKFEAIHIAPTGYVGIVNPETGIKISQYNSSSYEDMGTFTFNVWGAPWYTEQNSNTVSSLYQRTINAYDYKYGGLYVEVCVTPDQDPNDVTKPYAVQIKINGMNLTKYGTTTDKKIYLKNNFNTGSKFFDSATFYGSRIPASGGANPLQYGGNNNTYMYDTYLDNIYVIGGTSDQDCFLGPTTKIFNIAPITGSTVNSNSSWQAFNLAWNTNTSIEDSLKDSNGDKSYVYTETSGAVLAVDMANIPSDPNYAIGGIKITNSVRKSNKNTSFVNVWGTGSNPSGMNNIGNNFTVNNNQYEYKNQYLLQNPVTNNPWTFTDINDGKFGIKKTS